MEFWWSRAVCSKAYYKWTFFWEKKIKRSGSSRTCRVKKNVKKTLILSFEVIAAITMYEHLFLRYFQILGHCVCIVELCTSRKRRRTENFRAIFPCIIGFWLGEKTKFDHEKIIEFFDRRKKKKYGSNCEVKKFLYYQLSCQN